jgi:hypothetical protein
VDQFARFKFDLLDVLSDRLLRALNSAWPTPASVFFKTISARPMRS